MIRHSLHSLIELKVELRILTRTKMYSKLEPNNQSYTSNPCPFINNHPCPNNETQLWATLQTTPKTFSNEKPWLMWMMMMMTTMISPEETKLIPTRKVKNNYTNSRHKVPLINSKVYQFSSSRNNSLLVRDTMNLQRTWISLWITLDNTMKMPQKDRISSVC